MAAFTLATRRALRAWPADVVVTHWLVPTGLAVSSPDEFPGTRLGDYGVTSHIAETAVGQFDKAKPLSPGS